MSFFALDRIMKLWSPQPPKIQQPDLHPSIYEKLDWRVTAVAGSYALHKFTSATNWQPNDVDIMIACQDKEDFNRRCQIFAESRDVMLVREAWFDEKSKNIGNSPDELFHKSVLGSKTYQIDGLDKNVQLICLQQSVDATTPAQILSMTSDIPACVSYTMFNGQKIFSIPEKGAEILLTKRGPLSGICASRESKYKERGYEFY